jgi:hypothetical protein
MPETATPDTGLLPRTYFKAPRVPLDLRALLLALVGYWVFRLGGYLLGKAFDPVDPIAAFFAELLAILRIPYVQDEMGRFFVEVFVGTGSRGAGDYTFWHELVGGAWTLAVWGFFAQGIHRITALRIARDEGLSIKDALKFSARNFVTIALCPVIVFVAIALFYGCNALAGLAISIPGVGSLLAVILVPLAVISTLLILLIAIGGVVGLPLVGAAAAWERNGSLDAISRAFSYIFARPLQFFWNYFLIFLFTTIILVAGAHFETILVKSIDAGILRDNVSVMVDTPERLDNGDKSFEKLKTEAQDKAKKLQELTTKDGGRRPNRFAKSLKSMGETAWYDWLTIVVFWVVLNVVTFGVFAVALWWFFGATTCTYADLRADVDGTDEDEIYLEEEEEDFEALAKVEPPAGTPSPSSPPPTGPGPTPTASPTDATAYPPPAPPPPPPANPPFGQMP